jgi:hypothetical protein
LIASHVVSVALFAIERKPIVKGGLLCNPWEFQNTHEKLLELITSRIFLRVGINGYTSVFILICHLTKMAHFDPCHKEITAEESANLFIDNCYRLHGVAKVIVSDGDPTFFGRF